MVSEDEFISLSVLVEGSSGNHKNDNLSLVTVIDCLSSLCFVDRNADMHI